MSSQANRFSDDHLCIEPLITMWVGQSVVSERVKTKFLVVHRCKRVLVLHGGFRKNKTCDNISQTHQHSSFRDNWASPLPSPTQFRTVRTLLPQLVLRRESLDGLLIVFSQKRPVLLDIIYRLSHKSH